MLGDFSRRQRTSDLNLAGVLYQQGRVFIDTDGNAATQIANDWQDTAGKDAFGADVAAIPADEPLSFRVDAIVPGAPAGSIDLHLQPGRCWADGLLVQLPGPFPVARRARYLVPPVQTLPVPLAPAAGARDAVILDVWREALSAFQTPDDLIEPALGGPDTTERVLTSCAFRLLRLVPGDTCSNLANKIDDNSAAKGRLTVTLQPLVAVGGDCPVVDTGGYVGFEHNSFRIEIAEVNAGTPVHFKWSQFNGGLVGRGVIDPLRPGFVRLTANLQPIITSGITDFYLESRQFVAQDGHWRTTYGARVTLNNANELVLPVAAMLGAAPAAGQEFFFRLWNGIQPITAFPPGANNPFVDGLRLSFDADAAGRYTPEDFWTFTVRADGVPNAVIPGLAVPTLINNERPHGVHHHRVPIAILTYGAAPAPPTIDDCRNVFQPLTKLKTCCTFRVGDGLSSFGDFNSIQQAVNALPPGGGEICLLPGVFTENVRIVDRRRIRIHGCGNRSRVVGPAAAAGGATAAPVFFIQDSRDITLESFAIEAAVGGAGVVLRGVNTDPLPTGGTLTRLLNILIARLRIIAGEGCAIESRNGRFIRVRDCDIRMRDVRGFSPAIFVTGDDMEVEHNKIRVRSDRQVDDGPTLPLPVSSGRGGVQIGGGSERVRVIDNWIQGGRGNGITLGSVIVTPAGGGGDEWPGWIIDWDDPCNPCHPGNSRIPDPDPGGGGTRISSAGALYDIRIERNRIFDMGLNGIGVVAFFNLEAMDEMISVVRLDILGNEIRNCLQREIIPPDAAIIDTIGYGAIQLAEAIECVIRGNTLVDNGPSYIQPVCGIFVLHAEGIDISDNRIVNNGAATEAPEDRAEPGARAGIFLAFATAPTVLKLVDRLRRRLPVQNGVPAVKVHDNIVSQPLGHALYIIALGPVSVEGNQFTSHATVRRSRALSMTFVGATVFILNLGVSNESYLQFLLFTYASAGGRESSVRDREADDIPIREGETGRFEYQPAGGNVMFVDNQVLLDLQAAGETLALASITILTLDDLAFESNQCDCYLLRDFVLTQAMLAATSVRAIGNRFKEGRFNALFSAITYGIPMNCTSQNQATHCILAESSNPAFLVFSDNAMLWGLAGIVSNAGDEGCQRYIDKRR